MMKSATPYIRREKRPNSQLVLFLKLTVDLEPEWATDEDEDNLHCEASKNHIT